MSWIRSGDPTPLKMHDHGGYVVEAELIGELSRLLPFLKHPGFGEELEWRLMLSMPGSGVVDRDLHRLRFLARRQHIITYVPFALASEDVKWPKTAIVIGPSLRQVQQHKTINLLLRARLGGLCGIYCSDVPFRE